MPRSLATRSARARLTGTASINDRMAVSRRHASSHSLSEAPCQERCFCILIVDQMKGPNGLRFNCKSLRFNCNLFCNWIVDSEGEELISGLRFNCNRQLAIGGNTGNEVGSSRTMNFVLTITPYQTILALISPTLLGWPTHGRKMRHIINNARLASYLQEYNACIESSFTLNRLPDQFIHIQPNLAIGAIAPCDPSKETRTAGAVGGQQGSPLGSMHAPRRSTLLITRVAL
jgi:hypothetical protein